MTLTLKQDLFAKQNIALIDVSSFIYRAYFAFGSINNEQNQPIGALYGVCSMLLSFFSKNKFDNVALIFDSKTKTFRSEIFNDYKKNRPSPPKDLLIQLPQVRILCQEMGFFCAHCDGFEADDLIASYAYFYEKQNFNVQIVSSDKDLMQLINENITMYDALNNKVITVEKVVEKFGIYPHQVADYLSLVGDVADNVPGVDAIGAKTAADLLKTFQNIDEIYKNLDKISKKRIKQNLIEQKEQQNLSKRLVQLRCDLCVCADTQFLQIHKENTIKCLESFGITSLNERVLRVK